MKKLIAFRKEHGELHQKMPLRMMDYKSCGYPDLSYHGEFPWKPDTTAYSRQLGMMYCGRYGEEETEKQDEFLYVAYNLHWEPHEFALPRLPKDKKWKAVLSSVSLAQKETQKLAGKEAAEESKRIWRQMRQRMRTAGIRTDWIRFPCKFRPAAYAFSVPRHSCTGTGVSGGEY